MKLLKMITLFVKILILMILLIIACLNIDLVKFTYLPEQSINVSLIVIVFGGFVVGTIFGIFSMLGRILRLRSETNRLRAEVQKTARLSTQEITAPMPVNETQKSDKK